MERSLRMLIVPALAAVSLSLAIAAPANATPPVPVAGNAVPLGNTLTARPAGGNAIFDGFGTEAWAGALTGSGLVEGHFVEHASGILTYQVFATLSGSTPCGDGTVRLVSSGSGPFSGPITGTATTVDEGVTSLPLHAELDLVLFLTPLGPVITYTGDVHCD